MENELVMVNSYFNENTYEELIDEIKYVYKSDDRPWVIGYSGGKDSTTVVELVYEMLRTLSPEERHKKVYIISSDTMIENPDTTRGAYEKGQFYVVLFEMPTCKKVGISLYLFIKKNITMFTQIL